LTNETAEFKARPPFKNRATPITIRCRWEHRNPDAKEGLETPQIQRTATKGINPRERRMSEVKITVGQDQSLKVEGPAKLLDHEGKEIQTKEGIPFFLCRCGASKNKPFCDGSHNTIEFKGSE
jgi:hypothetical protein